MRSAIFPLLACVMMGRSRPPIIRSPLLLAAPEVVARADRALLGHGGLDGGLYHLGTGVLDPAHVAEAAALAAVLHKSFINLGNLLPQLPCSSLKQTEEKKECKKLAAPI